MEKKRHLESDTCEGTPSEQSSSKIIKKDEGEGFICTVCNAEIKHKNNIPRHRTTCKVPEPKHGFLVKKSCQK